MGTRLGVGVVVGGLLHVEVVPCVHVRVVAPGLHAGQQIACRLRRAAERAVHHCHEFGTGDVAVRAEAAVGIAVDPAHLRGNRDFLGCPVARANVIELCSGGALQTGELCDHRSELGAGDRVIRTELAVRSGVDDHAGIFERSNVGVVPVAAGNVRIGAAVGLVVGLARVAHDAVQDRCGLRTGDIAFGLHGAVGIAVDKCEVVFGVERQRRCLRRRLVRGVDRT